MSAEVMNVRQTAELLGVHENTVRNWNERGLLRGYKLPGSGYRRFPREEVERMRREMLEQYAPMTELVDDAPLVRAEMADGADDLM
jgi:excisionase family DNA binding protein